MKAYFGIFVILSIVIVTNAQGVTRQQAEEMFRKLAKDCVGKTGATNDDLEALIKHETAKTREGKCLGECMMKQFETLTADGKLQKDNMIKFAAMILDNDEEKLKIAEEILDGCLHITDEDHCELASKFGDCLHKGILDKNIGLDW